MIKYTIRSIICEASCHHVSSPLISTLQRTHKQTDEKHKDLWYASQTNKSEKQITIKMVFMQKLQCC